MKTKKKIIQKLEVLEKRMNTNFNYMLYGELNIKERLKEDKEFVYKFSESDFHSTKFRLNSPYYKTIYQPFIQKHED